MSKFSGADCPVCRAAFVETDDIVVCPDCGTPHHRHCYAELSACGNKERHGGFVWKSPIDNAIHGYAAKEEKEINETDETTGPPNMSHFKEYIENIGINRDYYEKKGSAFENRDIFGVSEREIICFQGGGNPLLTEKYRRIANGHKVSFNIMAMLFFPYTAFYSRMRIIGIIMVAVDFALRLPYTLLFVYYNQFYITGTELIEAGEDTLLRMNSVLSFIQLVYRLFSLLFYDYIYLRWMARKIKEIRAGFLLSSISEENKDNSNKNCESVLGESYYSSLRTAGKPSFLKMLLDSVGTVCALASVTLIILNFL